MPMPDAERWRSDLLALSLQSYAGAVLALREQMTAACNPDEPEWYAVACERNAALWARSAAGHAHSMIRHARQTEDQLYEERERTSGE